MSDEIILGEPWDDANVPAGFDARRVYEHAVAVGGVRRQRRRRRRNVAAVALIAVVALASAASVARDRSAPAVRVAGPSGGGTSTTESASTESTSTATSTTATPGTVTPGTAVTSSPEFTSYKDPGLSGPQGITIGPDGALWFTDFQPHPAIGRIAIDGHITLFHDATILGPVAITTGPGDALWFTNSSGNSIGRITTAGVVTNYTDPSIAGPSGITMGPDGAVWFTNHDGNSIGRITGAGIVTSYSDPSINGPESITNGPDGALWFTNFVSPGSIGRITTAGVVTDFTHTGVTFPDSITHGPDGALWFTNYNTNTITRITTAGMVTNFSDNSILSPEGITTGPDGALWFANSNSIGRITPTGALTNFTDPSIAGPQGIAVGPDGALWFTNFYMPGSIDRMTIPPVSSETTTTTVPASPLPRDDPCPVNCIGRATADIDGDGAPDQIGFMGTPKPPLNLPNVTGVKLVVRVVFGDGRVAEYHDTAEWDASLVGTDDLNGDGKSEILYFNDTGANLHSGHILRWDGAQLVAVRGSDGKPFSIFTSGYALGGDGFRCSDNSYVAMTIHDDGNTWVASATTYRLDGNTLTEVSANQPIPLTQPPAGPSGDSSVPPEYESIIGVHCPGIPSG